MNIHDVADPPHLDVHSPATLLNFLCRVKRFSCHSVCVSNVRLYPVCHMLFHSFSGGCGLGYRGYC